MRDGLGMKEPGDVVLSMSDPATFQLSEKPVAGNNCYVQTKDIIMHPIYQILSDDINQCGKTSCRTCNLFVNDQSLKSNLTGKTDFNVTLQM